MPTTLQRHPISAEYPDITGPAWDEFVDGVKRNGTGKRKITLLDGKVLDGWQLYRACLEVKIAAPTEEFDGHMDPRAFVDQQNDHRRHESIDTQRVRRIGRRERIAAQRDQGDSLRTIAAANGVSVTQVRRDLAARDAEEAEESGVPQGTPEPSRNGHHAPAAEEETVKGKDGKTYPKKQRDKKATPAKKKSAALKDDFGNLIPDRCRDAFADPWLQQTYDSLCLTAEGFRKQFYADGMKKRKKAYPSIDADSFIAGIGMIDNCFDKLIEHIKTKRPAGVCKACAGNGCSDCSLSGLVPREVYSKQKETAKA